MVKAQAANTSRLANRPFTWDDRVWLSWDDAAAVLLDGIGMRRRILILVPYMWLLALFLAPFAIVFRMSMSDASFRFPPTRQSSTSPGASPRFGSSSPRWTSRTTRFSPRTISTGRHIFRRCGSPWSRRCSRCWTATPCLRDGPRSVELAADADDAGDSSVLDQLPDSGLLLDRNPLDRGLHEPASLGARADFRAARPAEHHDGGLYRHRLHLSAVHDPAGLRVAGAASTIPCSRRPRISDARGSRPSGGSPCRCRRTGSSPAAFSSSSR